MNVIALVSIETREVILAVNGKVNVYLWLASSEVCEEI